MLITTYGLPGSGKTTHVKRLGHVRCNRDGMREVLHGGFLGDDQAEFEVSTAQVAAVEALLAARITVAVDDCNLFLGALEFWRRIASRHHHEFIVYDFTGVDVEECVRRAAGRPSGEADERVIRSMHARYFPLPELDESLIRHIRSVTSPPSEEIKMTKDQDYQGEHKLDADATSEATETGTFTGDLAQAETDARTAGDTAEGPAAGDADRNSDGETDRTHSV